MKKKLAALLLSGSILTANIAAPYTVFADELTDKIEQQEQKVYELTERVGTAEEILNAVKSEIAAAESRASELLTQRVDTQTEITTLEEEIIGLQDIIEQREEQLQSQARSVQTSGSSTNYLNFIFASDSFTDLVARFDVVTTMVSANKDLVEQQVADQQAVADKKVESEEKLNDIMGMTSELEQLKAELHIKEIEQKSAIAGLNAEKATAEDDRQRFLAEKEEADRVAAEEAAFIKAAEEAAIIAAEEAAVEVARQVAAATKEAEEVAVAEQTEAPAVEEVVSEPVNAPQVTAPVNNAPATVEITAPEPKPEPVVEVTPPPAAPSGDLISAAYKYIGVPYVWGGKSPSGFDCSGFTSYVFREAYGMEIGGWTGAQEGLGTRISTSQAQAGDLLFWGNPGSTYHVAISLGGNQYIHAPSEGGSVEVRNFSWFNPTFAVRVGR